MRRNQGNGFIIEVSVLVCIQQNPQRIHGESFLRKMLIIHENPTSGSSLMDLNTFMSAVSIVGDQPCKVALRRFENSDPTRVVALPAPPPTRFFTVPWRKLTKKLIQRLKQDNDIPFAY